MGSHRAQAEAGPTRPRGRVGRPLLAAVVAVGVVAAGIGLANVFRDEVPLSTGGPVVAATGAGGPHRPSPTPAQGVSTGPSAAVNAPAPTAAARPVRSLSAQPIPIVSPVPKVPVWVYYNTPGGAATADDVALRLRKAGWFVEDVEFVRYRLAETTVYYENRFVAAAHYLRATFRGIGDAQLRPQSLRPTNGLILLVTGSYVS